MRTGPPEVQWVYFGAVEEPAVTKCHCRHSAAQHLIAGACAAFGCECRRFKPPDEGPSKVAALPRCTVCGRLPHASGSCPFSSRSRYWR